LGSPKRNFGLLMLFIFIIRPRRGVPRVVDIAPGRPKPQDRNAQGRVLSAFG
jgi:hypothetical protein